MSAKKAAQDLADEAALARSTRVARAGWDLEVWRITERKKDEAKARAKKAKLKPPLSKEEAELQAQHLLRTSHGTVSALNALFQEHVAGGQPTTPAKSAPSEAKGVDAAIDAGRRWRESKKRPRRSSDFTLAEIRRARMKLYRPGTPETSRGAGHPSRT